MRLVIYGPLLLFAFAISVSSLAAQTNSFPSSGNAWVQANLTVGLGGVDYGEEFLPNIGGNSIFWIDDYNNTLRFSNGNYPGSNPIVVTNGGRLGLGTTEPGTGLFVSNYNLNDLATSYNSTAAFSVNGSDVNLVIGGYANDVNAAFIQSRSGGGPSTIGPGNYTLALNPLGGAVGIGTTSPGATLEVNGNVKLTANSGASVTFADGTTQSTAYTGVSCGGDFAESVDVTGDRRHYEPGDLLVIDPVHPGDVLKSATAYSTSVAGIYSTKPGYVGRRIAGPTSSAEVPMAIVGIVPTKVSAENGPVRPGDLLVTASLAGYAMKGTVRSRMLGAVVGKAMGSLKSGTGVVEVLVALQ